MDNTCEGQVDEGVQLSWYADEDGDAYGVTAVSTLACSAPAGFVEASGDCDDSNARVYPGAVETCDGTDESCNGQVDDGLVLLTYYQDADQDGHGSATQSIDDCAQPSGYVLAGDDCQDLQASVYPGATEVCNAVDEDCDGVADDGLPSSVWYVDGDTDGYGAGAPIERCSQPEGTVAIAGDCDDQNEEVHPGASETVCSGIDDDCKSSTSDHPDGDGDGYDSCDASVPGDDDRAADCNDGNAGISPGAIDLPGDQVDSNCNTQLDVLSTVAGSGSPGLVGDGGPGEQAMLNFPYGLATAPDGTVYIAELYGHKIRRISSSGIVSTLAGTGTAGFSGDGGAAASATLRMPHAVALNTAATELTIADTGNLRVRRVNLATGIITTVAGNGAWGTSKTTGKAVDSPFKWPVGVMINPKDGKLFVSDTSDHVVRKIENNNDIKAFAGTGKAGFSGDGAAAGAAALNGPTGLVGNSAGDVFIVDQYNHRVRRVQGSEINTVAGNGSASYCGDGGAATSACLSYPSFALIDPVGQLVIADAGNMRVRRVGLDGKISTLAGNGTAYFSGDGGSATTASFYYPEGLGLDSTGNLFVADNVNCRVRKITPAGAISSVLGSGSPGYNPKDTNATTALLFLPSSMTQAPDGSLYVSDHYNHVVRKISPSGSLSTVAGMGVAGFSGDNGPATAARLSYPFDLELDSNNNLYVSDLYNCRIRKVSTAGIISTVAGSTSCGSGGDGGPATSAYLNYPYGIAVDSSTGILYIADTWNHKLRKVVGSTIYTVAGTGTQGFSGDGGQALSATLDRPFDVEVSSTGTLYLTAPYQNRVRKVDTSGMITTIAGTGTAGFAGDGTAATSAQLNNPSSLALDPYGNLYISDTSNQRIRLVTLDGAIRTVAGSGDVGFNLSTGAARQVNLFNPYGLHADGSTLLIGDQIHQRVRRVVF